MPPRQKDASTRPDETAEVEYRLAVGIAATLNRETGDPIIVTLYNDGAVFAHGATRVHELPPAPGTDRAKVLDARRIEAQERRERAGLVLCKRCGENDHHKSEQVCDSCKADIAEREALTERLSIKRGDRFVVRDMSQDPPTEAIVFARKVTEEWIEFPWREPGVDPHTTDLALARMDVHLGRDYGDRFQYVRVAERA